MTSDQSVSLKEHMDAQLAGIAKEMRGFNYRLREIRDEMGEVREENRRDHQEVRDLIGDAPARVLAVETTVDIIGTQQGKLDNRVEQLEKREDRRVGSFTALKVIGGIGLTLGGGSVGAVIAHFLG